MAIFRNQEIKVTADRHQGLHPFLSSLSFVCSPFSLFFVFCPVSPSFPCALCRLPFFVKASFSTQRGKTQAVKTNKKTSHDSKELFKVWPEDPLITSAPFWGAINGGHFYLQLKGNTDLCRNLHPVEPGHRTDAVLLTSRIFC